jgi:hypothetical protein
VVRIAVGRAVVPVGVRSWSIVLSYKRMIKVAGLPDDGAQFSIAQFVEFALQAGVVTLQEQAKEFEAADE